MNEDRARVVATSPLMFLHPRRRGSGAFEAIASRRFEPFPLAHVELMDFFCRPQPISAGIAAGHSPERIQEALDLGILRDAADESFLQALLWEERRWSRAAYFTFLQRDAHDREHDSRELPPGDAESARHAAREKLPPPPAPGPAPARRLVPCESVLSLPDVPEEVPLDLDAVVGRRSLRTFADAEIPLDLFTSIVYESTRSVRQAERPGVADHLDAPAGARLGWMHVYVVIQGVLGVGRGVYQYDPLANNLRFVGSCEDDREIAACIHGQSWIGGGGFCLFAVAQWERCMWLGRHSRGYLDLLTQIGEFSQEVLFPVSRSELGAWMTPAIHETRAARLLRIEDLSEDAVFFMKIGPPRTSQRR